MKKKIYPLLAAVMSLILTVLPAYGETEDEILEKVYEAEMNSAYDTSLSAPFSKEKSGVREDIDPETGALFVTYDLFELKGRGGAVNESLALRYDSRTAKSMNETVRFSKTGRPYNDLKDPDRVEGYSGYGAGWSIYMPYLEREKGRSTTYLHLPDGGVYKTDSGTETGLFEYKKTDLSYNAAKKRLDHIDGTSYFFDGDGNLAKKTDRFGNTVLYDWSENKDGQIRLKSVTDNAGGSIKLNYDGDKVKVSCSGREYVLSYSEGGHYLNAIQNPDGTVTSFSYDYGEIDFTFFKSANKETNTNILLKKITSPSGLVTEYEYGKSRKWLNPDDDGYTDFYRITARRDIEDGENRDCVTYSYEGAADGYPDSKKLSEKYVYSSSEKNSDGVITERIYDSRHNMIKRRRYSEKRSYETEEVTYHEKTLMPIKDKVTYTGESGERTEYADLDYDRRGNLLREDRYTNAAEKGERVKTYKYSEALNILVSETYKTDKDTTVETVRTLGEMGTVTEEAVLKNGEEIKRDRYTYDGAGNMIRSEIDLGGKFAVTEYEYDASGRFPERVTQKEIETASGEKDEITTSYRYDELGLVTEKTDGEGNRTKYEYDKMNRLTKETLPDGWERTYEYDTKENTIDFTDAEGGRLKYSYTPGGALSSVLDKNLGVIKTSREYDKSYRLVKNTDAEGAYVKYEYDELGRYVSMEIKSASGGTLSRTETEYDEAYNGGTRLTVTEGTHECTVTVYEFDAWGNNIKKTVLAEEGERTWLYDSDYSGNVTRVIAPGDRITEYTYDVFGNAVKAVNPDKTEETYEYDNLGNVIKSTNAEGESVTYGYDSLGRNIFQDNGISRTEIYYDRCGNTVKTVDGEGNASRFWYNSRGMMEKAVTGDTVTEYSYDREGRMTESAYGSIKSPERIRNKYVYRDGLLIETRDNAGESEFFEYDNNGRVILKTDKNGTETSFCYDGLGRTVKKTAGSESAEAGYDGLGRQIYASRNGDEIHYVYNGFGELTGEVSLSGTKKYTYDEAGLLTKKEISSKLGIEALTEYEYDKMNRPVSVKTAVGTETVSYDKAGRITEKALGATGERVTYSYNADGTVKQSIRTKQGNIVYSERYEYDKNGNRVFSEENGEIRDYWYDENNRLKKIRIGGEGGDYEIYEFDGFGNISTKVEIDGNYIDKTQYSYDNRNRLISSTDGEESTAYEYDKNGNLKKKVDFYGIHSKTETYTYTAFGELKTAEGDNFFAEYYYGADGFRSGKKVNGVSTGYVYDGMYIVGESVDGVNYTYSRGTDLLGYTSSLGETVYYRTNVHGDVKELVNVFGESLERYDYNAYGAEDEDYNPFRRMLGKKSVHNPFRYTGEYTDSETGLVYLRNRMYDPETGRFTTEDPAKSGVNWYAYCEGNPINFIDPWGLEYIVVSGSEHNTLLDQRYKYNFIEPAIKKLRELKELDDKENITWLISSTGYSERDISNFKQTAADMGVNIEFFKDKNEFIAYINQKGENGSQESRMNDKIHKIIMFAHGVVGSIEFGYHQKNQKDLSISFSDILRLDMRAFENPNSCFFSCNTATNNEDGTSFAQAWVNRTGGSTWAIYEKSDYGGINDLSQWDNIIKPERRITGYRQQGSDFYPSPSKKRNAFWKVLTPNVYISGVKR